MGSVFSKYIWLFITPLPSHRRAAFLNSRVRGANSLEEAGLTGCAHQQQEAHTTSLPTLLPEPGGGLLQQRPGSGQVTHCLPALTGVAPSALRSVPLPSSQALFQTRVFVENRLHASRRYTKKHEGYVKFYLSKTILIFRSWGICKQQDDSWDKAGGRWALQSFQLKHH